eukprot:gnl/TRDRNA2_/TRDRNA2_133639_c0_seq1.p1 gnl/TRDRNA2_/TRDRNA2_133639_c0~~gnl/TRDRNA2_/TRDRNA2_133639_c0_seq1.p1  ORF type:complete len:748 (-),score=117.33 gnl/TRDRNA2_/TRDRNA2_133639_c0_seq1:21-2264(-)
MEDVAFTERDDIRNYAKELATLLTPNLAIMRQELRNIEPAVDPEIALLAWLCEKRGFRAPENMDARFYRDQRQHVPAEHEEDAGATADGLLLRLDRLRRRAGGESSSPDKPSAASGATLGRQTRRRQTALPPKDVAQTLQRKQTGFPGGREGVGERAGSPMMSRSPSPLGRIGSGRSTRIGTLKIAPTAAAPTDAVVLGSARRDVFAPLPEEAELVIVSPRAPSAGLTPLPIPAMRGIHSERCRFCQPKAKKDDAELEKEEKARLKLLEGLERRAKESVRERLERRGRYTVGLPAAILAADVTEAGVVARLRKDLRSNALKTVPLLHESVISEDERLCLVDRLRPTSVTSGTDLVQEGGLGDQLFIVERGLCDVMKVVDGQSTPVSQIGKGAFFCGLALLHDVPNTATVRAKANTTVLTLAREDLLAVLSPDSLEKMQNVSRTMIFSTIPTFQPLDKALKTSLAQDLRRRAWPAGSVLCRAGTRSGSEEFGAAGGLMHIIEEGTCRILSRLRDPPPRAAAAVIPELVDADTQDDGAGSNHRDVSLLHPGHVIGMLSMFYGSPEELTAVAETEVATLSLSSSELSDFAEVEWGKDVTDQIARRMRCVVLRYVPSLQDLDEHILHMVLAQTQEIVRRPWDIIFNAGDHLDCVWILEEGSLVKYSGSVAEELQDEKIRPPHPRGLLKAGDPVEIRFPGECFGLDCKQDWKALAPCSLIAAAESKLLRIPGSVMRVLTKRKLHMANYVEVC